MYTFEFNFDYHFIIAIVLTLLFTVFSFLFTYCNLAIKRRKKRVTISILVMSLVFLVIGYLLIFNDVIEYFEIKNEIYNNRISYVEGYVENFSTPNNPSFWTHEHEEFDLEGIHFIYYRESYGYTQMKNNGGIIRENSRIKIGYIEKDERNVIVFIQIID